jgi:hypothetical protein
MEGIISQQRIFNQSGLPCFYPKGCTELYLGVLLIPTYAGFPGVLEKFLAVDFKYLYMKALQTHKRHGVWA